MPIENPLTNNPIRTSDLKPTAPAKWISDHDIILKRAEIIRSALNAGKAPPMLPEYVSGARAVVWVNNKKVAACLDVSWSVSIDHREIRTIDSQMPWELVPSQIKIGASLRRIIHPDRTAAGDGMFTIIAAALHTPVATIEVRDRLGNVLFLSKGAFTDLESRVATGALAVESLKFMGYYWRQNDEQTYDPDFPNKSQAEKWVTYGKSKLGAVAGLASQLGIG